jgi:excisionase family DNA binding protein
MSQSRHVPAKRGVKSPPRRAATSRAALVPSNDITEAVPDNAEFRRPAADPPLLGKAELARFLGISERTIERLRSSGRFPAADIQFGTRPRWRRATIEAWIQRGGR